MRILFLSLYSAKSILHDKHIYPDLLRGLVRRGCDIVALCPGTEDDVIDEDSRIKIVTVKIDQIQKNGNLIRKGLATVWVAARFKRAVKCLLSDVTFDLVLFPTPPITLVNVVKYVKLRDNAKAYLMLKDIFPQNAVDLGMMSRNGLKGIIYRIFRQREKRLYKVSDKIGCMSPANVEYLLKHNPDIDPKNVELCPNCIEIRNMFISSEKRTELRDKYGIPQDKTVFVYGGNLGKPQNVPFIIECLRVCQVTEDAFFLIVGSGTDFGLLADYIVNEKPHNVKLMKHILRDEYDGMIAACDVGLIFLDYRFTIPNFPSRILGYMHAGLPILTCTDTATDVGEIIVNSGFGWWCWSNSAENFKACIHIALRSDIKTMGRVGNEYLRMNYTVEHGCNIITQSFNLIR